MTTKRQRKLNQTTANVLRYIAFYISKYGYSPTMRELMIECQLGSTSVASYHIDQLVSKGYLIKMARSTRTMKITEEGNIKLKSRKVLR